MEGNTSFEREKVVNYGHAYEGKIIFLFIMGATGPHCFSLSYQIGVSAACITTAVCDNGKQYKEKKIRHRDERN